MNDVVEPSPEETREPPEFPLEVRYRLHPALIATALVLAAFLLGIGMMPIQMAAENAWTLVVLRVVAIPFGLFAAYAGLYAGLLRRERVRVGEDGILEIGLFGNRLIPWKDLDGLEVEEFQTRSHRVGSRSMRRSTRERLATYRSWMLSLRTRSKGADIESSGVWKLARSYSSLDIDLGRMTADDADRLVRVVRSGHARFPPPTENVPSDRSERNGSQAAKERWMLGSILRALVQAVVLGLPLGGSRTEFLFLIVSVVGMLLTAYRLVEAFEFRAPRWTLAWLAAVVLVQQGAARLLQGDVRGNFLDRGSTPMAIATLVASLSAAFAMAWIHRAGRPKER